MHSLFRQTQTRVHSTKERRREEARGLACSARAMAAIQLGTQLILWVFFQGYDRAAQAVWQAALMLLAPLVLVWAVWRKADTERPDARRWMLMLTLNLALDAAFLIFALGGFIRQLVPGYPLWVTTALPTVICLLTALCARARGVRYGASVLAAPLVILLVFGTVFLRASTRADRLWPILGDGLASTARCALAGCGSVWGAALLFALPNADARKLKSAGWAAVPWALCVLCALWFGFLNPWKPGDGLPVAEKMMGLARHAHSVILYEISGVMWMLLIPTALTACFSSGEQLIRRAFPRVPRALALLMAPLVSLSLSLLWPNSVFAVLEAALPWRLAVSLLCGLILLLGKRRA